MADTYANDPWPKRRRHHCTMLAFSTIQMYFGSALVTVAIPYCHNRADHYMLKTQECKSSISSKHVSPGTRRLSPGTGSRHVLQRWRFSRAPCLTRPQRGRTWDAPYNHLRCFGWLCTLRPQHQYSEPSDGTFLGWHVAIMVLWYLLFCFLKIHLKARWSPAEGPYRLARSGEFRQWWASLIDRHSIG